MARKEIIEYTDDIDGTKDDVQTVYFALDDRALEIDLSAKNRDKLVKALEPFMAKARPDERGGRQGATRSAGTRRGTRASAARKAADRPYDIQLLREWGAEKKKKLPARGRIPGAVIEEFQADVAKGWQPKA